MIQKSANMSHLVMLRTATQIYLAPNPLLRGYVAHYTISFANNSIGPENLTLIPDASGCAIFSYDGSIFTSMLWGATTKTVIVKNDVNEYPFRLFIEFLQGGLFCFTKLHQAELTDRQIPLTDIDNQLHSQIAEAFERATDLRHFIAQLDSILLSMISNKPKRTLPPAILSALDTITRRKGCLSLKDLASSEYYSSKQLNRLFNAYLGTSVKKFSTIFRLNYVLQQMKEGRHTSLDIAQSADFYDQAHFIHSFKAFCGTTPQKYIESMSTFYNEPFKF